MGRMAPTSRPKNSRAPGDDGRAAGGPVNACWYLRMRRGVCRSRRRGSGLGCSPTHSAQSMGRAARAGQATLPIGCPPGAGDPGIPQRNQ